MSEHDACPRCGRYRPNGCLCHIQIPKSYTREDLAQAWDEGYDARGRDIANEGLTERTLTPNPYRVTSPAEGREAGR
jgi:hypothetical protein